MIVGPRQRFTGVAIGAAGDRSVCFVQQTLGALYILVKYWGANLGGAGNVPGVSLGEISWDGTNSKPVAGLALPGTAGNGVGSGIYFTGPSGISLNLAENLGYPVYYWFNPTPLVGSGSTAGFGTPWPFPFPAFNVRLTGATNAITLNADCWCIYPDRPESTLRYTAADTLPFVPLPT